MIFKKNIFLLFKARLQLDAEVATNRHVQESGRLQPNIYLTIVGQATRTLDLQLHRTVARINAAGRLNS